MTVLINKVVDFRNKIANEYGLPAVDFHSLPTEQEPKPAPIEEEEMKEEETKAAPSADFAEIFFQKSDEKPPRAPGPEAPVVVPVEEASQVSYWNVDSWTLEQIAGRHWDDPNVLQGVLKAVQGRGTPQSNLVEMSVTKRLQELQGEGPDYSAFGPAPAKAKVAELQRFVGKYIKAVFPNTTLLA
jgi:hypothetical protein